MIQKEYRLFLSGRFLLVLLILPFYMAIAQNSFAQSGTLESDSRKTNTSLKGYLSFNTNVDSFYVVVNENFDKAFKISGSDSIQINAGKQHIRVIKKYYRDLTTTLVIKPDTLNKIPIVLVPFQSLKNDKLFSSYPRIFWQAPVIIKSDKDAKIYADNQYIGTGTAQVNTTNTIKIKSVLPSGEIKEESLRQNSKEQTFIVKNLYHRPKKTKSRYLALIPGASQIYQDNKLKGYALLGATIIGVGVTLKFHLDYKKNYTQFKKYRDRYNRTQNTDAAFRYGNIAEKKLGTAITKSNLRNNFLIGTLGIYAINIIDAFIRPKIGYRKKDIRFDPYIDFEGKSGNFGINASLDF